MFPSQSYLTFIRWTYYSNPNTMMCITSSRERFSILVNGKILFFFLLTNLSKLNCNENIAYLKYSLVCFQEKSMSKVRNHEISLSATISILISTYFIQISILFDKMMNRIQSENIALTIMKIKEKHKIEIWDPSQILSVITRNPVLSFLYRNVNIIF